MYFLEINNVKFKYVRMDDWLFFSTKKINHRFKNKKKLNTTIDITLWNCNNWKFIIIMILNSQLYIIDFFLRLLVGLFGFKIIRYRVFLSVLHFLVAFQWQLFILLHCSHHHYCYSHHRYYFHFLNFLRCCYLEEV